MVIFGGLLSLAIGFGLFELDIEEWDAQTKACILYYGGELMGVFGGICISTDGRRYCCDAGIGGGWAMLVLCGCLVSATGLYRCRINYMDYIDKIPIDRIAKICDTFGRRRSEFNWEYSSLWLFAC